MRFLDIWIICRLFFRLFKRRLFRVGALRSRAIRRALTFCAIILLLLVTISVFLFLRNLNLDSRHFEMMLRVTSASSLLAVVAAFLIVKTLFLNAEGIAAFTYQLPVTNRSRKLAFYVWESMVVMVVAVGSSLALTISSLAIQGWKIIPAILESIVAPTFLFYMLLSVVYVLMGRILSLLKIERIQGTILLLMVFGLFVTLIRSMGSRSLLITSDYLSDDSKFYWFNAVVWSSNHFGGALTTLFFLTSSAVLACLSLILTPNDHFRSANYLRLPVPWQFVRLIGPSGLSAFRSSQTFLSFVLTTATFIFLLLGTNIHPCFSFGIFATIGVYQFSQTERALATLERRSSPLRSYWILLRPQLVIVVFPAIVLTLVLAPISPHGITDGGLACLTTFATALISNFVGIVFPAENESPFPILFGFFFTLVVILLLTIGLGIFEIPRPLQLVLVFFTLLALVIYSIAGISSYESRKRYEAVPASVD